MLPNVLKEHLKLEYGDFKSYSAAAGGCINHGGIAEFDKLKFFIKWNSSVRFPDMFEKEAKGLNLLRKGDLKVPMVIQTGIIQEYTFLLLEPINPLKRQANYWEQLALGLSALHRITQSHYGLNHDNYMGSLAQSNDQESNWIDFFINRRLTPQIALARDNDVLSKNDVQLFDQLYKRLPEILVCENPSLLHGDLWNGNIMTGNEGEPVLIDPAIYFGHREVDLAMTKLFGGFSELFYSAYEAAFQTEAGLHDRLDIYNLYPLLVHVNLFGGSYYHQTMSSVKRFI